MDTPPPPPTALTISTSDPSLDHPVNSSKLRLMLSYGGHILPHPHDKSLTYIGGTTRLILLDRPTSATVLLSHISLCLPLDSHRFTLKYRLPNDDLDSLVSLSSDEDLCNFLDEYDRLLLPGHSSSSPRVRLFLFFDRPTTATSIGPLLETPDDEGWFLDALNSANNAIALPHSVSDSAADASGLLFCEADVGDDVSKLTPVPIKVKVEDPNLNSAAADERSSDQGIRQERLGSLPCILRTCRCTRFIISESSSITSGSSLRTPDGGKLMNPTPTPDFPYLCDRGSEPAYLMMPSLVDRYRVLPPQPQLALMQQHYGNTRANYMPHTAVTGAGQVFVQSYYYPMYVVPARANITATGAHDSCVFSAPPLVQLPPGRRQPHQEDNLPGNHLSLSTAVSFDNPYNLFEQSRFYGQLPATTKVVTPHYQNMAVTAAATSVLSDGSKQMWSETMKQEMQEL